MRPADLSRLLLLGALWGGSFIFMRMVAPTLGAAMTAESRMLLAGVTLVAWLRIAGVPLAWRSNWRSYALIGVINSALPFVLYAYAALQLPASYLVVLNATSPLFGALMSASLLGERMTARTAAGLAAGVAGVALLVGLGPLPMSAANVWALAAGALAALCYAVAGALMKRRAANAAPAAFATGSQLAASAVLLPLALLMPPEALPRPGVALAVVALAVVALGVPCTAVAYLLYFRLVADVGPTRALTVTFLIPVFGMLWGALLLGEAITPTMVGGCALILLGVGLISAQPVSAVAHRATQRALER